jgi:hypothetical protein
MSIEPRNHVWNMFAHQRSVVLAPFLQDEEGVDAGFLELRRHDLGLLNGDQSVLVAMDDKDRGIVQAEKGAANDSRLERT